MLVQRRKEVKLSQTSLIIVFGWCLMKSNYPSLISIYQYLCCAMELNGFQTSGNFYTLEICKCLGQERYVSGW